MANILKRLFSHFCLFRSPFGLPSAVAEARRKHSIHSGTKCPILRCCPWWAQSPSASSALSWSFFVRCSVKSFHRVSAWNPQKPLFRISIGIAGVGQIVSVWVSAILMILRFSELCMTYLSKNVISLVNKIRNSPCFFTPPPRCVVHQTRFGDSPRDALCRNRFSYNCYWIICSYHTQLIPIKEIFSLKTFSVRISLRPQQHFYGGG